jgi:hypothetical protein
MVMDVRIKEENAYMVMGIPGLAFLIVAMYLAPSIPDTHLLRRKTCSDRRFSERQAEPWRSRVLPPFT